MMDSVSELSAILFPDYRDFQHLRLWDEAILGCTPTLLGKFSLP